MVFGMFSGSTTFAATKVKAKKITLKKKANVTVGKKITLKAKVKPAKAKKSLK